MGYVKANTGSFIPAPLSFFDDVVFRFNAKDDANFVLRHDSGIDYVVSYTDPISGITVGQGVASRQPRKNADNVQFDGIDDFILHNLESQYQEVWIVCNSLDGANFDSYDQVWGLTGSDGVIYASASTTKIYDNYDSFAGPIGILPNSLKINNIYGGTGFGTAEFAPLSAYKTIQFVHNTTITWLRIGGGSYVYYWNGCYKDVICFNRILTPSERADLQNYLQTYHGFTP